MKPESSEFRHQHREELTGQQTGQTRTREFGTVEDMIRHDAAHTDPPPAIEDRLRHTLAHEPPPRRGWWRRLFPKS